MAVARARLHRVFQAASGLPRVTSTRAHLTASPLRACFSTSSCLCSTRSRLIPEECKSFISPDGRLRTTQANADLLREYNITHDSAMALGAKGRTQKSDAFRRLGVIVNLTPEHLISPYDLYFLDPRGHPLASMHRERYAHKALTQPLWLITTCSGGAKAVVRHTAQGRLRAALFLALEARGYDRYGQGKGKAIHGTLWLHVVDPITAVNARIVETFGDVIMSTLEDSQRRSTHDTMPRRRGRNKS